MQALEELRTELQINTELTEIVDALKLVAVSEYRDREHKRKQRSSLFLDAFEGFFQMVDLSSIEHPFAHDTTGKLTLVILSSDERFMGGLNKRIVDTALEYPGAHKATRIVVGTQGCEYLDSLSEDYIDFTTVTSKTPYRAAVQTRDRLLSREPEHEPGRVVVIYPKCLSFMVQVVEALPLLPCTELLFLERKQAEKAETQQKLLTPGEDVILDSSPDRLVEYLARTWITEKLVEVFEEARLAELSAKAVRLEESHQTLEDGRQKLTHEYHRTHHEVVDKGMRETFSAQIIERAN